MPPTKKLLTLTEAETADLGSLVAILKQCDVAYHNHNDCQADEGGGGGGGDLLMSDRDYDALRDVLERRDPKNAYLTEIGHKVADGGKEVALPVHMGSMDKAKDQLTWDRRLPAHYAPNELVYLTDKMDGISILICKDSGGKVVMYRRGDGTVGSPVHQNVVERVMVNHPRLADLEEGDIVRAEAILPKTFVSATSPLLRSCVNGLFALIHYRHVDGSEHSRVADAVQLVCFEIIDLNAYNSRSPQPVLSRQFERLYSLNLPVVGHKLVRVASIQDYTAMGAVLAEMRTRCPYEMDGVVLYPSTPFRRNTTGNPPYAFAFKQDAVGLVVRVTSVDWKKSRTGKIVPTIEFEAIVLQGSTVRRASGSNARMLVEKGIGVGAMVEIAKGGDVIPTIVRVVERAVNPLESFPPVSGWMWDENKVHIVVATTANDDDEVCKRQLEHFIKTFGIEFVGPSVSASLYDAGFKDPRAVLGITKSELMEVEGIRDKGSDKILASIATAKSKATLLTYMVASGVFEGGIGKTKLKLVIQSVPSGKLLLPETVDPTDFENIKLLGTKSIPHIVKGLDLFKKWTISNNLADAISENHSATTSTTTETPPPMIAVGSEQPDANKNKLAGCVVLFTGFRNAALETLVVENGGNISDGWRASVTLVVAKDKNGTKSGKVQKAIEKGIQVLSEDMAIVHFQNILE